MYSALLMMALTTGADAPAFHHRGHGCCGCYGYSYSCGGGYGYSCGGYGYGGCYGYGGFGYGCSGYGYGGCCGFVYGAAYDASSYSRAPDETAEEFGFCQKKAKEMSPEVYSNFRNSVWLRMTHPERKRMMDEEKGGGGEEESSLPLPARILVTLPADASLTIDDQGTTSAGTERLFVSPPLSRNGSYTLKAEFVRHGKTVSVTKQVAVSPGEETSVSFNDTGRRVASR